jgi:flagellar basal body L-ring protein FlgH
MFWYILLVVLTIIFAMICMLALVILMLCQFEVPEILLVVLLAAAIAFGLGSGAKGIKEVNTTIDINVTQMEITKCDIGDSFKCYLTLENKYVAEVSLEQYMALNVGDIVTVEIKTETQFGEEFEPVVTLK